MRRFCIFVLIILSLLLLRPAEARAVEAPRAAAAGEVLCIPDIYTQTVDGCEVVGPNMYLQRMSQMGVQLPLLPLAATAPDPGLAYVEYNYARVVSDNAPVYATLDDARGETGNKRIIESGFDFISYIDIAEIKGTRYFQLRSGEWMYGGDLSRISIPRFQGLEVHGTPDRPFGWILYPTETKRSPGYETKDYTDHRLNRYDLVQVYGVERVDDLDWFLVGPDEWVEQRLLARVVPAASPPRGVENGRWIEINLYEQTVAVYEGNSLVYATLISTGLPGWWTRPGLFQIYVKLDADTMRGAFEPDRADYYYLEDVPFTMYFDEARALHGAYWHNGFGYPRSHGCVNLAPGDARWIYEWAQDGDWVYVHDPSGRTPEDPDLYSPGGA